MSIKVTHCDKCHNEIKMKRAIIRYPMFLGELFRLCQICANEYDQIESEIDAEAEKIKEQAFKHFMGIK